MRTRFAPSPTGPLHLGHAYSACLAHDMAVAEGGTFLLRIEDIDQSRARPRWEAQIYEDLHWLGLDWPTPVMRQSDRMDAYNAALDQLWDAGLLYPCHCNRRDILAALDTPQEGVEPPVGPDGVIYPGTCRPNTAPTGPRPKDAALRLDMARALERLDTPITYSETGTLPMIISANPLADIGDIVLARRDMGTSYHLSVTVDDAEQDITHVVRGADLAEATQIHVLLQRLLNLPTPTYHHHKLIRDENGKRLAKRDDAKAIALYREQGKSPQDVRQMVGL